MLLARKAKKSWHGTYMPGKVRLLLPWLPRKSGQGRAFQGWVAKVAIKARLWPGLTGFSRPYFSGKPGQKPGKPGLAGLCQACRAFGRTPDAREHRKLRALNITSYNGSTTLQTQNTEYHELQWINNTANSEH